MRECDSITSRSDHEEKVLQLRREKERLERDKGILEEKISSLKKQIILLRDLYSESSTMLEKELYDKSTEITENRKKIKETNFFSQ